MGNGETLLPKDRLFGVAGKVGMINATIFA